MNMFKYMNIYDIWRNLFIKDVNYTKFHCFWYKVVTFFFFKTKRDQIPTQFLTWKIFKYDELENALKIEIDENNKFAKVVYSPKASRTVTIHKFITYHSKEI